MSTLGFWLSLALTVAGLVATYHAGRRRRRRRHVTLAVCTVAMLAVAILFAEAMARERDFPRDIMRIHLVFAKGAGLAVLPVVITGLLLLRREGVRRWHLGAVWVFLALVVTATVTGVWAFSHSTPR